MMHSKRAPVPRHMSLAEELLLQALEAVRRREKSAASKTPPPEPRPRFVDLWPRGAGCAKFEPIILTSWPGRR